MWTGSKATAAITHRGNEYDYEQADSDQPLGPHSGPYPNDRCRCASRWGMPENRNGRHSGVAGAAADPKVP